MSRLKNTRRKRKKEKKNNTRKRGTSIYVCVSGTRRREKEKQRRRAVTLTPCNREKPVKQHGIKPRLEEWLSAGAWLKTGVQYRNNRWHPVCVCCSSREGEKKKIFLQRIHRASKIFRCLPRNKEEVVGILLSIGLESDRPRITRPNGAWKRIETYTGSILSRTCPKPFDQAPIKWPRLTLRQSLELWKSGSLWTGFSYRFNFSIELGSSASRLNLHAS